MATFPDQTEKSIGSVPVGSSLKYPMEHYDYCRSIALETGSQLLPYSTHHVL